ncbi:MAG: hypothetical protein ACK5EX_03945, partial [Novosphingobium sp.]
VAVWRDGNRRYLAAWPTAELARIVMARAAADAGLATCTLPAGLRVRRAGQHTFGFNYSAQPANLPTDLGGQLVLGEACLEPGGVAVLA